MAKNGRTSTGQRWECSTEGKARSKRYNATDAGRDTGRRYWTSAKGQATAKRNYESLKAQGLCTRGDGRTARPGYTECAEHVTFRNTDPAAIRRRVDAHNRDATRLREERLAGKVAEVEAIQKRIRDADAN